MHPVPLPLSTSFAPPCNLPLEYGIREYLASILEGGFIPNSLASLFPVHMEPDEYTAIADWLRLPSRIAYAEIGIPGKNQKQTIFFITEQVCITQPITGFWNDFMDRIAMERVNKLLPCQVRLPASGIYPSNATPTHTIVHDIDAGCAAMVPWSKTVGMLTGGLRWSAPEKLTLPAS